MSPRSILDEKSVESSRFAKGSWMKVGSLRLVSVVLLIQALWVEAANPLSAPDLPSPRAIPLEKIDEPCRASVRLVLEKPILSGRGPGETFPCQPEQYAWILDHPDRAVVAWRRLGAKCVSINPRGDGKFGWADEYGSEVIWQTVCRTFGMRIWYAEGKVRPGPLLPLVPVKAVVVLRHRDIEGPDGTRLMHHQSDLFIQTDSKTAAMMTRMLGPAANRMAEQGLGQLQLFFSGLTWYLERHPDQSEVLFKLDD